MTLPTYQTGTASVANGGTVVTGTGAIWSGTNVKEGDFFARADGVAIITEVTDSTHLKITPWPGATVSGGAYTIHQFFSGRVVGEAAARDVDNLVAALDKTGFIFFVGPLETAPDPSLGDDGQYGEQPSTGKRWIKTAGVWVYLGIGSAIFTRYDLASFDTDRPASGELILKIYPPGVTFRSGLTDSAAGAEIAATGSSVFSITKNGTQFATITFAASSAVGVFACAADVSFTTGDVLRIIAPAVRDATLSGVAATIIGYR